MARKYVHFVVIAFGLAALTLGTALATAPHPPSVQPLACKTVQLNFVGYKAVVSEFIAVSCPTGTSLLTKDMKSVAYVVPSGSEVDGDKFARIGGGRISEAAGDYLRVGIDLIYTGSARSQEPGPCGSIVKYENSRTLVYDELHNRFVLGPGTMEVKEKTLISNCR